MKLRDVFTLQNGEFLLTFRHQHSGVDVFFDVASYQMLITTDYGSLSPDKLARRLKFGSVNSMLDYFRSICMREVGL